MKPLSRSFDSKRCPLCSGTVKDSMIKHLTSDHRRTEVEARALLQRSVEGTLGWDPEAKKRKESFPFGGG